MCDQVDHPWLQLRPGSSEGVPVVAVLLACSMGPRAAILTPQGEGNMPIS